MRLHASRATRLGEARVQTGDPGRSRLAFSAGIIGQCNRADTGRPDRRRLRDYERQVFVVEGGPGTGERRGPAPERARPVRASPPPRPRRCARDRSRPALRPRRSAHPDRRQVVVFSLSAIATIGAGAPGRPASIRTFFAPVRLVGSVRRGWLVAAAVARRRSAVHLRHHRSWLRAHHRAIVIVLGSCSAPGPSSPHSTG
jgi:hypothetical protein